MVGTTYHGAGKQKEFVDRVRGTARIIPIYQITPTTVNSPNLFRKHGVAKMDDLHPTLARWYSRFHAGAISGKYFLSVFSYSAGIDIGLVNKYYDLAMAGDRIAANHYTKLSVQADACLQCGHCESRCPFGVKQEARMEEINRYFGGK